MTDLNTVDPLVDEDFDAEDTQVDVLTFQADEDVEPVTD